MGVDLAVTQKKNSDYTASTVLGVDRNTKNIYILDIQRDKLTFNNIINFIVTEEKRWKPLIIGIEDVAAQNYLIQELLRNTNLNIKSLRPKGDKVSRFHPVVARFEQNMIYINENIDRIIIDELLSFPDSEHDDCVDSLSYAYSLTSETKTWFHLF
jgi:predicted phage terminase large subunit-like protein